jgi:hypothetical protein
MTDPTFFLGTHQPGWLARAGVRLFVSDVRLRVYKALPHAIADWAVDSGGFSELQHRGAWTVTPAEYVTRLRRYRDEIGRMLWCAPQDWMCEPIIINGGTVNGQRFVGTGLSVAEHQRRTVLNFAQLREIAPDLPIIPVLQGWDRDDYLRCADLYWSLTRVDVTAAPLVGLGSVCRRQGTAAAGQILAALRVRGVQRIHGFGFKILGLLAHAHLLASADSMAWSDTARKLRRPSQVPGCTGTHKNCANCMPYALRWRRDVLAAARTTSEERTSA